MANAVQWATSSPRCPNHGAVLQSCGDNSQAKIKKMQCPVSAAIFEVAVDQFQKNQKIDKFGNKLTQFTVKGEENV